MISKIIPPPIKQYIIKLKVKLIANKVRFGKLVIINLNTQFEGYNALGNNTQFVDSFLGIGSYIANNSTIRKTKIGKYCAIGDNVRTYLGNHPVKDFVSIHPAFFSTLQQSGFTFTEKQLFEEHKYIDAEKRYVCQIGNDVWIGNDVLIIDGIEIGNGAVVASGAIVTKNVEPYTIVGGVPAKQIRKRFSNEQIEKLEKIKWWDKDIDWVKKNSHLYNDIKKFLSEIS